MKGHRTICFSCTVCLLALTALVIGCGATTGAGTIDDGGGDLAALRPDATSSIAPRLRYATRVVPSDRPGVRLLATAPDRLDAFYVERQGDVYCPDCNIIARDECPQACARDRLMRVVMDHAGKAVGSPVELLSYFPATPDHALEIGARRYDPRGWIELIYYFCDNGPCSVGISSRSCSAFLARVDLAGARLVPDRALYADRWGDVTLHANTKSGQLLFLYAPPDWGAVGAAQWLLLDEQREPVQPWMTVGSDMRLSQAAASDGDDFVVVISDRDPHGVATTRCESSCECVQIVSTLPASTGLAAYRVNASGASSAASIEGGRALTKPQLRRTRDGLMLAGRVGETLHSYYLPPGEARWRTLPTTAAPTSDQWLLAFADLGLPEAGQLVAIGGDVRDDLAQRLKIVRIAVGGEAQQDHLGDYEPVYYFDFTHTLWRGEDGSARLFVQRAVWPEPGADDWERWEILRVDVQRE